MAPEGTVTVSEPVLAAVTLAFTPPTNTILPAGVALKLRPVMVTVDPTGPEAGEKALMAG
ncbi:hypothetical protein A4R26_31920 [Niastella populi]|uniref:Uncharacterized protein n=1 Tax=Niastella populi TaxID=550983 RepID=A0A1V9ENK8_9BACT|nr:hypothetical protein A4R26_31920 [Niastella populi]